LAAIDDRVEDREWVEAVSMVVADKPPRAWLDADVVGFEVALSDLARRFVNLEALCADRSMVSAGDEALRLTVTRADGREVNRLVWIDRDRGEGLEELVDRVLEDQVLAGDLRLQEAFLAILSERVFLRNQQD
jgi:hypothetical protein